jgi:hypothetical protein
MASGRESAEARRPILLEDTFGDDRTRTVAGAQEQNIEHALSHEQPPSAGSTG